MVRAVSALAGGLALATLHAKFASATGTFRGIPELLELEAVDGDVYARDALAQYVEPPEDDGCHYGEWVSNGDCNAVTLLETFTQTILAESDPSCEPRSEQRRCKPVHCEMSAWSDWDDCNADGNKIRTRTVQIEAQYGGRECPHHIDIVKCRKQDCRVCDFGPWVCDEYTGKKTRSRHVTKEKELDGKPCPALEEIADCDPVDCVLSKTEYEEWTECDENTGEKRRRPKILVEAKYNGKKCPTDKDIIDHCPKENCVRYTTAEEDAFGHAYGECKQGAGPDTKYYKERERGVKTREKYGGECPVETDREVCEPVDCVHFTKKEQQDNGHHYGECKEGDDKKFYRELKLDVKTAEKYGGKCKDETDREVCEAVDCDEAQCHGWNGCNGNAPFQTRACPVGAQNGGKECVTKKACPY